MGTYDGIHTEQEAQERLFAGEHNMKSGEHVQECTQRFHEIVRDVRDMTESEMIAWFVYVLPSSMRKSCSTDAHAWPGLEIVF
jgi:hypothetical protein